MRITGYIFQAEILCPTCTIRAVESEARYDGWADASIPPMTAEDNLSEIASAFGIDRMNEHTFDSDDFPKVIFSTDDDGETCDHCFNELSY